MLLSISTKIYFIIEFFYHRHRGEANTFSMVWYSMVWYGIVWYGMVWYGETGGMGQDKSPLLAKISSYKIVFKC